MPKAKDYLLSLICSLMLIHLIGASGWGSDLDEQLLKAVKAGNAAEVKAALEAGANPNYRFGSLKTPILSGAAMANNGNQNVVRLILCGGADIDEEDAQKMSALEYAVLCNKTDIVRLLLCAGATLDRKGRPTTLSWAATYPPREVNFTIMRILLAKGANKTDVLTRSLKEMHDFETLVKKGYDQH
jgi:ankyrin repeat protein